MADKDSRRGNSYASEAIFAYADETHVPHDAGLAAAFDAPSRHGIEAIQVGRSEGKVLGLLLRMIGARRVVEIGTLAGYSAIHMARALPIDGRLWTIEIDPKHARIAQENLVAANVADRVVVVLGPALRMLPTLESLGAFDAVFLDADKESYDRYGRWAARHVRRGGLLLADNAYYFGELLDDSEQAAAMRRFHQEARESFDTVCLPTPDGMLLGIHR